MKRKTFSRSNFIIMLFLIISFLSSQLFAQITISGQVVDEDNEPLIGVNIRSVSSDQGTTTDFDGRFSISFDTVGPVKVLFTYIGYADQEMKFDKSDSDVNVIMFSGVGLGTVYVIGPSKKRESWVTAPVTVEIIDLPQIRRSYAPDPYDDIANVKGVQTFNSSLNFPSYNFRGFGAIANERFVQLIDWMDNAAPLLNFPTGNIVGISSLDLRNIELVPGAASALYGPNAFNGILMMSSKNPFDYQGLSVDLKGGMTTSEAGGSHPYYQIAARYAYDFNDRFAFKVNVSLMNGTDRKADDYTTGRRTSENPNPSAVGSPDFDGMNTYGDETQIVVPMGAVAEDLSMALAPLFLPFFPEGTTIPEVEMTLGPLIADMPTLDIRRTGFKEEDLLESMDVKSIKLDGALHYRITDSLEVSYNYRYGQGSSVYQGGERYVLDNFTQQFHKVELKSTSLFARGYISATDAGDSYNLSALGAFANERFSPSAEQWVPTYAGTYAGALLVDYFTKGSYTNDDVRNANQAGRLKADEPVPQPGTKEYQDVIDKVRQDLFQRNPPGAGFVDNSKMYHAEAGYDFKSLKHLFDLQIGGNYRLYDLFSDGTVFNEDPEGTGTNSRVKINEYGFYGQIAKRLINNHLNLTASLRYDKNENFDGQVSPRISAVYSIDKEGKQNIRGSFQTGFRNPSSQQQFIYFPTGVGILLGSTQANAERYGVHNGGAYTVDSYNALINKFFTTGEYDPSLLEVVDVPYVKPEQIQVFELGYKAVVNNKFLVDANAYYNIYNDFISQRTVMLKESTTQKGNYLPGVDDGPPNSFDATAFRLYVNAPEKITSFGVGLGLSYKFYKEFTGYGHYNYSTYTAKDPGPGFEAGFNMPENKFLVGISNTELFKNFGFDFSYRWQSDFLWENAFAIGEVPAYGIFNGQINYTIKNLNTMIKIGGTNILGSDYRTNIGGPNVGSMYYVSLTFDNWL